ncbi:MAG: PAC2 family protein [Micromonosporaceae bacterium]|nr:PAC2 family protein [Micromonosporaceae bacterium]
MRDPQELYRLDDELPDLGGPVLLQALTGFVDAGAAIKLAREHLLGTLDARPLVTFDTDALLDYRSRRPTMLFIEDHWESYEEPRLVLHLVRDAKGAPFLLLAGPEPDLQWERFIAAMDGLIDRLGVSVTVGLNAIPMAVPHTRPPGLTAHSTRRELIAGHESWLQRVQVPASIGNLLEFRLGQRGRDAIGFAIHVPHYLAQAEYPAAAAEALEAVSRATGLSLPTGTLHEAATVLRADIDRQVAEADEAAALVRALEQQYDTHQRGRAGNLLAGQTGTLPTAEELGAELERFLAEQGKPGDPPPV